MSRKRQNTYGISNRDGCENRPRDRRLETRCRLRNSGLGAGLVRLFCHGVPVRYAGGALPRVESVSRVHTDADTGDAAAGCIILRLPCGQVRAQTPVDRLHPLFFPVHGAQRTLAELYDLCDLPRALRHRHGRILGNRRVVRDGEFAAAVSRSALWHDASWVSDGLPAGVRGDADPRPVIRLAVGLLCGRAGGGADCGVDTVCAGVRSVETTSAGIHETNLRLTAATQRNVLLSVTDDERDVVTVARYTGFVSRFSEVDSGHRGEVHLRDEVAVRHSDSVQHRRNRRLALLWSLLAKAGQAHRHHARLGDCAPINSCLGVRNLARHAGCRIVRDADRRDGGVRRYPCAPERAFAGCGSKPLPGICVSAWSAPCFTRDGSRILVARSLWISPGSDNV